LPSQYRGLNTQFPRSALVLVGCVVINVAQYDQMGGRSCRNRGVCDVILYVNTGESENEYMTRLKDVKYSDVVNYIEFLNYLQSMS
jgi:hypothetical protein